MPRYSDSTSRYDGGSLYAYSQAGTNVTSLRTNPLRSKPILIGNMRESQDYRLLAAGSTDRIFLIGHTDGLKVADPLQVSDLQQAINYMNADVKSPLLNAMMQSYFAGARDLYLVSAAPMVEYVEKQSDRLLPSSSVTGKTVAEMVQSHPSYTFPSEYSASQWNAMTFYERYFVRLQEVYRVLLYDDLPHIVIPLEAPFYGAGGVDFVTQLTGHCNLAFWTTGTIRLGFLGSKGVTNLTELDYQNMMNDTRFPSPSYASKFVALFLGEAIIQNKNPLMISHMSPIHLIAAKLATSKASKGLTHQKIPGVLNCVGLDIDPDKIENLAQKGINTIGRTSLGKRGQAFNTITLTDNTIAEVDSDFWSIGHTRLSMLVIERLRGIAQKYIGTINYPLFKDEVYKFMTTLKVSDILKDYSVTFTKTGDVNNTILLDVMLQPYFGIRTIQFTTEVGPGI